MCTQATIHYFINGTSEGGTVLKFSNRKLRAKGQKSTNLLAGDSVFISCNILTNILEEFTYFFYFL